MHLRGSFYALGVRIAKFPKLVASFSLLLSFFLTAVPAFPSVSIDVERSAPRIYYPTGAKTFVDWEESLKFGGGEVRRGREKSKAR